MFTNTLLCSSLVYLMVESKLGLELDLFAKQININKYFSKLSSNFS